MLVFTRKVGQKIHIGNDIVIVVSKLRNNDVRIGIEAPRDMQVMRGELIEEAKELAQAK
jgi:carbon storage regulator